MTEQTDSLSLERMRQNLSSVARCSAQLSELQETYGMETLGDRLRFTAALEQLERASIAGGGVNLRGAHRLARERASGVSAACSRARGLLQEGNAKASEELWPEANLAYREGLSLHLVRCGLIAVILASFWPHFAVRLPQELADEGASSASEVMTELQQAKDAAQSVLWHQAAAHLARGRESASASDWEAAAAAFTAGLGVEYVHDRALRSVFNGRILISY